MMQALEKSDFPAEPFFIRRVADAMASAIENGWEDVTVEDIMPYVEGRMKSDFGSLIGKHKDPVKLEKLLGKDVLNDYRKHSVAKVKAAPSTTAKSTAKPEEPKEVKPRRMRIDDIGGW
jgi:hypothetical protein